MSRKVYMTIRHHCRRSVVTAIVLLPLATVSAAAEYESAQREFKAADLLDPKLVKGANHTIQDPVVNKGYINHYQIASPFGEFSTVGDSRVPNAVHEINVIAELQKMSKTGLLAESAAESAANTVQAPIKAAGRLVEDPVGTVKGVPAGVGRLFARAKDTIGDVSKKVAKVGAGSEDSGDGSGDGGVSGDEVVEKGTELAKSYLGVSGAHRKLARKLRVDPYSRNPVLQQELSSMAKYAAAGSFGAKLAMPSIPGVGLITSVDDLVWNLSSQDLRLRNEKALAEMGADESLIERLFDNPHYTPSERTRVVAALETIAGAQGRDVVVAGAAGVESAVEALFFSRMAEMMAAYHQKVSPIKKFVDARRLIPLAVSAEGVAVLSVAADYIGWTESTESGARAYTKAAADHAGNAELRVEGRVSERARAELEKLGWSVFDNALKELSG